jgi:hypothetical protein
MGKPPTEKQIAFRASLLRKKISDAKLTGTFGITEVNARDAETANRSASADDWWVSTAGERIAELAFALALPEPADAADCSAQIDALQGGGGCFEYARGRREWGETILARLVAAYGDDPDALPRAVRVGDLRAAATGARNG